MPKSQYMWTFHIISTFFFFESVYYFQVYVVGPLEVLPMKILACRVFSLDIDLKLRTTKDSNWKCSVCDVHFMEVNYKIDVKIYVQSIKSNHRWQNSKNIIFIPLECVTIEWHKSF